MRCFASVGVGWRWVALGWRWSCVVRDPNLGHQLLLTPANRCPMFAPRATHVRIVSVYPQLHVPIGRQPRGGVGLDSHGRHLSRQSAPTLFQHCLYCSAPTCSLPSPVGLALARARSRSLTSRSTRHGRQWQQANSYNPCNGQQICLVCETSNYATRHLCHRCKGCAGPPVRKGLIYISHVALFSSLLSSSLAMFFSRRAS